MDFPERLSGRTPSPARTSGTPSIIMSPDHRPWTQITLGAGTRNAFRLPHRPSLEAVHDLNHNVFALSLANRVCGGSSSASRSFVLAALRALHLDPDCGSTAPDTDQNEAKNKKTTKDPPLRGSSTQIRKTHGFVGPSEVHSREHRRAADRSSGGTVHRGARHRRQ